MKNYFMERKFYDKTRNAEVFVRAYENEKAEILVEVFEGSEMVEVITDKELRNRY